MSFSKVVALGGATILLACSSTGVVPMDRGTFMVSKVSPACGFRSADGTRAELYVEANQHCGARRQEVSTISMNSRDGIIGVRCASAELVFRCVAAGTMDAGADERIRRDVRQDRRDNQLDMQVAPRPIIVPPTPTVRTDCTRFGDTVNCTTR